MSCFDHPERFHRSVLAHGITQDGANLGNALGLSLTMEPRIDGPPSA